MSLKILIAGCLPKDRREIEGVVKKAFGNIPESDPWSVSLVKMRSSWSISLEGKNQLLSLTALEDRLLETIAKALSTNGTANPTSPLPLTLEDLNAAEGLLTMTVEKSPGTGGPTPLATGKPPGTGRPSTEDTNGRNRYECSACGQSFKVIYTARPREKKIKAPAACPHCWHLSMISIPESAAANEEYRTEAIST